MPQKNNPTILWISWRTAQPNTIFIQFDSEPQLNLAAAGYVVIAYQIRRIKLGMGESLCKAISADWGVI